MANPTSLLITIAAIGFFLFYLTKQGCKGDGANGLTGENMPLCFPGFEALGVGGGLGGGFTEEDIEEVSERNQARQITPPEKRGIISNTQTSDPVGSGGGVGGPSKPVRGFGGLAQAFASYVNNRITVA